jgi:transposase
MSEISVQTERVDDIPLLIKQQQEMGIAEVIDQVVSRHGNRNGLSLGWMMVGWLAYILSQSDHRLSYVEGWAAERLATLNGTMPGPVAAKDFSDDRLGDALGQLSEDEVWRQIEVELNQRVIRVYGLPTETIRVDSTTVAMYHAEEDSELIAYGPSKDHRPDLAQVKVLLNTLDPMALPLVTLVVSGNQADDGLYVPAIQKARGSLLTKGLLYVGDSKMESLETRAFLVQGGDSYLVPLSRKGAQGTLLDEQVAHVLATEPDLVTVYAGHGDEKNLIARGWETVRDQEAILQEAILQEARVQWQERLLLIYSPALARSQKGGLRQRLRNAERKLARLTPQPGRGKRQHRKLAPLQTEVAKILKKHRVADFLHVDYHKQEDQRMIRSYNNRPARTETSVRYQLVVSRKEAAIETVQGTMGWRLYATNAPQERLSMADAVRTYRSNVPTIERLFSRLNGHPLGLRPLYVHREDHITGLVRLLSLALRLLTLIEFIAQQSLRGAQDRLQGLYPGNPTRATDRPTTERLLQAFKGIDLTIVEMPDQSIRHVTPLSELHDRILLLLRFPTTIYSDLAQLPPIPP